MEYKRTDRNTETKTETLETLFAEYGKRLYRAAYGILRDEFLAEDAVQTAFYKLIKYKCKIDTSVCNKTQSFLVIIVRNVAIGIYNSRKKEIPSYEEDELSEIADDKLLPLDIVISNENVDDIYNAMGELNSKYADILIMKYISDFSYKEIASLFDISEQLVRVRLHRAKKLLLAEVLEGKQQDE